MALAHTQILGGRAGARKGMVVLNFTTVVSAVIHHVFIADQAYQLVSVEEVHAVAGGDSAAVEVEKLTGTAAPFTGTTMLVGTLDLTGTANTVVAGTLHPTLASTQLAQGDRIALIPVGTPDALAGVVITMKLVPMAVALNDTGDRRYWLSEV